jgi:hypothetical protein
MKFAWTSSLLAPVVVTARLSHNNKDHEKQHQHLASSSYSKVKATRIFKKLNDRLAFRREVRHEPNKIHNIDDEVKNNTKENKGTNSSNPTAAAFASGDKEECVPPVTVSKTSKLDAGKLPLSSCSSSKKQICINNNDNSINKMISSSSIGKKTGICTDIKDVPTTYWTVGNPSASSDIPGSYWEDTVSTTAAYTATTTTTTATTSTTTSIIEGNSIKQYEPLYEEDIRYYDDHRNLQDSSGRSVMSFTNNE